MNALRIEGLGIRHDGRAMLRDVCLEVAEGRASASSAPRAAARA
ncbi:hypothetical protein [Teichococcus aestuarii]